MRLDDETLSALLDGELPAQELEDVKEALAADPSARQRLDELRRQDTLLRQSYGALDDRPLPEGLTARIMAASRPSQDNVIAFGRKPGLIKRQALWPASIAAAIILLLGLGYGVKTLNGPVNAPVNKIFADAVIDKGNPLYAVLDKTPSARTVTLSARAGLTAKPVLSLRLADGRLCREVLVSTTTSARRALACRQGKVWTVPLLIVQEAITEGGGYRTASDHNQDFDAELDQLGAQTPLDAREEAALIANGWQKAP